MEEEEAIIKGIETNETRYLYKAETGYMNILQTSDHDSDFFHKKPSSTNIVRSDKAKKGFRRESIPTAHSYTSELCPTG